MVVCHSLYSHLSHTVCFYATPYTLRYMIDSSNDDNNINNDVRLCKVIIITLLIIRGRIVVCRIICNTHCIDAFHITILSF